MPLGDLLRRARLSASLTVDQLADCTHNRGVTAHGWQITRDQVRDEIVLIEAYNATTFTNDNYRIFWDSVIWCLQQHSVASTELNALVIFLISQTLPLDFDPLLSPLT